jgi:hypothetical protein
MTRGRRTLWHVQFVVYTDHLCSSTLENALLRSLGGGKKGLHAMGSELISRRGEEQDLPLPPQKRKKKTLTCFDKSWARADLLYTQNGEPWSWNLHPFFLLLESKLLHRPSPSSLGP